uniref:Telomerase associated protein 1 n=1 Tax=Nothobranchius furzeri TaxID=105023 RepID=A0A8C6PWJ7_NOTFU
PHNTGKIYLEHTKLFSVFLGLFVMIKCFLFACSFAVNHNLVFCVPIQVAVYTRQELNIRITANFMLALAASLPSTKQHVRRYFCSAVQLPSDWLEVVRIYSTVSLGVSLPACLKKAMTDKFKEFSEYQLAKYNTRKHRCKHYRKKKKAEGNKPAVDKKQSQFSLKKLIRRLHIKEPAEHVMAILGRKYPSDAKAFTRSGLKGEWDRERAGQRMKLKEPQTWERLLSLEGNKAATWEKLIDNKSLPFMAMLRNLRNMITKGISEAHHKKILNRLTNQKAVIQSRQFPFRFLAAYKVIMELHNLGEIQKLYTVDLLDRYRKALETAVQISCRYNVPPLPGKTVILLPNTMLSNKESWSKKQDFCLPPDLEQKDKEDEEEEEEEEEETGRRRRQDEHDPLTPTVGLFVFCSHNGPLIWLESEIKWAIRAYRKEANNKALVVKIFLDEFVAERGSSRLLNHVEHLDKLYNIPPPEGAQEPQTSNKVVSVWQGVRVFISSTFRDMHAERDVLVRNVFPELRRRAALHRLYLQEVELRWGVTEDESERATELCLSEVCRSQMLVGILGERYGQVPPRPVLPDLPQYSWLAAAPAGLSITEMEIRQFLALYPDTAQQRMFCYFRDPDIIRSIPVAWRSDFAAESKEAEDKLASLKRRLLDNKVKVTEKYSCEWGGVVEGKPYLKNLEVFGKTVLEDLWVAVQKLFVEVSNFYYYNKFSSNLQFQDTFCGFMAVFVDSAGGQGGRGKRTTSSTPVQVRNFNINTPTGFHLSLLDYIVFYLCIYLNNRDLLAEFRSTLGEMKKPVVVLVDGVDLLQDGRGQLSSDWIPQQLPNGVCIVLSVTSKTPLLQTFSTKRGMPLFSLGQLTMPDRKEIIQKELDAFGKKLSDSAFNNQLQTLVTKKGAASPLYLHLACEDLRNFGSFDKVGG